MPRYLLAGAFSAILCAATPVAAQNVADPAKPAASVKVGTLTVETPWLRATPGGAKVAGGYLKVTNAGPDADRLLSVSSPVSAAGEVHEMSNEGGVMKMREVVGGLAVAPGRSLELKPGGFHLMLTGLKQPLKEGETVPVTLVFAVAGKVEVPFPVSAPGARTAPGPHKH